MRAYWDAVITRAAAESWPLVVAQPLMTLFISAVIFAVGFMIAWRVVGPQAMKTEGKIALCMIVGATVVGAILFAANLLRAPYLMSEDQKRQLEIRDKSIDTLTKQADALKKELASNPVRPELQGEINFIMLVRHPDLADVVGIIVSAQILNIGTPTAIDAFSLFVTVQGTDRTVRASMHEIEDTMEFKNAFHKESVFLRRKDALYLKHAERPLERGGRAWGRLLFGLRGITWDALSAAGGTRYELKFKDVAGQIYAIPRLWRVRPMPPTLPNYPSLSPLLKPKPGK